MPHLQTQHGLTEVILKLGANLAVRLARIAYDLPQLREAPATTAEKNDYKTINASTLNTNKIEYWYILSFLLLRLLPPLAA